MNGVYGLVFRTRSCHFDLECLSSQRLSPDDKTLELLVLRQQILILHRHEKRGSSISAGEKLILIARLDRLCNIGKTGKAQLEQLILTFKPETLIRWHQTID